MGSKIFLTTASMALAVFLATGAPAMDISVGSQVRLSAGYLSLNHDASHLTPPPPPPPGMASYGDPTSILSYEPLYSADIELVVAGEDEAGWLELTAAFPIAGGGTFVDRDYEAGQVLYSETFSDVALGGLGEAGLRFSLPGNKEWQVNGMAVQPYVVVGGGLRRYGAKGLACGAACVSPPMSNTITVIGQDMFSVTAGVGARFAQPVSERGAIDFRVEMTGGYLGVSDSHYFRLGDLGPVPNISYGFATIGLNAELGYSHAVSDTVKVRAGIFADGQLGFGNVIFSSAGGGTGPAIPAWSQTIAGGMVVGASVGF